MSNTTKILIGVIAVGLALLFFTRSDTSWNFNWGYNDRPPLQEFKEKCELRKAFHIYRDHEGVWACKLEDGRVMTEKDFRRFLNN